ncbi:MAG: hypothetical protein ACRCYS_11870 [Beijerinckiaceae bacterium]
MKRYMLTEPAFIGNALLAAGSIVTDDDLPESPVLDDAGEETGEMFRSPPPKSSIEVDEAGLPLNKRDRSRAAVAVADKVDPLPPANADDDAKRAEEADKIAENARATTEPQRRGK